MSRSNRASCIQQPFLRSRDEHTHANMRTRMQSAHAEGTGGTARQTTTTASAARRVRAGHAHAPCLARVRRPEVVVQARNAVLSERHARQARVVQLRRAVISRTPRRVAAQIEASVQQTQHGTDVSSARNRTCSETLQQERTHHLCAGVHTNERGHGYPHRCMYCTRYALSPP